MRAVLGGAVGALLGPLVVAVYLWIADHAQINGDELYAGCANEDYKNFLRLHIDHTGLTVYPIGLRRPSNWTFDWDTTTEAPSEPWRVATGPAGRGSAPRARSSPSSSRNPSTYHHGTAPPKRPHALRNQPESAITKLRTPHHASAATPPLPYRQLGVDPFAGLRVVEHHAAALVDMCDPATGRPRVHDAGVPEPVRFMPEGDREAAIRPDSASSR